MRNAVAGVNVPIKSASPLRESTRDMSNAYEKKPFFQKNSNLKRPVSPYWNTLSKPSITSWLSLMHRATGIGLTAVFSGFAITGAAGGVAGLESMTATLAATGPVWTAFKLATVWGFSYHTLNGIRHLNWDMANSLSLNGVSQTGYTMIGSSFVMASGLVFFL
jgi:succinate dehydrogenase (ubiquinone) cytochrome b560 subunit